ncbi:MFS transporter [Rhodococcus cerastii]|nr:MFS transporter [Rhodococcus cerastii]
MIALLAVPQLAETILAPALPDLAQAFSVDAGQAQSVMGVFFLGFAAGIWVWGRVCDGWGRRPAVIAGLAVAATATALCAIAPGFGWLLLGRVVQAFGLATCSVTSQTTLRDRLHGADLRAYFTTVGMVLAWSPAVGPFLGQLLTDAYGYGAVLVSLASILIVLCGATMWSWPETVPAELPPVATGQLVARMLRDGALYRAAVHVAVLNIVVFSFYAAGPFLIGPLPGLGFGWVGLAVAAVGTAGAAANRHLPTSLTSEGRVRLAVAITTCGVLGQLVVAFTVDDPGLWWAAPALMVFVGYGLAIPNLLGPALHNYSDGLGRAGALFGLAYYVLIGAALVATSSLSFTTPIPLALVWTVATLVMVGMNLISFPDRRYQKQHAR